MTSKRKHLLLCVGMMVVAAVPAAAQEPGGSAKKPSTPESLKAEIETLRLAKPAWREVAWHVPRLLSGLGPLGPRGPEDGPPALVIPGFLATDRTTMELRRALARAGWRAHPWLLGMNGGAKANTMDILASRLGAIFDEAKQPVLLVGWSLGGMFARELAGRCPEKIRAVITLGSPFSGNSAAGVL